MAEHAGRATGSVATLVVPPLAGLMGRKMIREEGAQLSFRTPVEAPWGDQARRSAQDGCVCATTTTTNNNNMNNSNNTLARTTHSNNNSTRLNL